MRTQDKDKIEISHYILKHVPREAEVTRIEYEGPMLAIYTKKPELLVDQSSVIAEIVSVIRKRIVIRSDPSVRLPEGEAEKITRELIASEAEISDINFDPSLGEIIIETKKPGVVIGRNGAVLQEIIKKTKWRPHVLRSPPIKSKIVTHMRHYLHSESKERERILRTVGERIFRPKTYDVGDIRVTALGGAQEVGRSAFLVKTRESSVLLDCGINPGSNRPFESFPRFDSPEFQIDNLDAVVISHAHLDHCGLVPFLYKYGYDGPLYCSAPTSNLMTMLQMDYLDVASKQGVTPFYDQKDVRECVLHTIPLRFGVVTDIAPDIRLTLHNSGHILGSSMIHLHIGEGLHNIVYTGDYKFGRTMLLEAATAEFPRIETVITESTYGGIDDFMPSRVEAEEHLTNIINQTLERKGKVLIPVPAVGRAQEIMLIIDGYMKRGLMKEAPVFIEGMISEATAIHTAYPEYLGREVRHSILHEEINPFQSDYFTIVEHPSVRQGIIDGEPCIVLATSGMLEGGPVIEYFKNWSNDERNTIIFVSYQIEGTMGKRVQKGVNEVTMMDNEGKMAALQVKMQTETINGFSGHSDKRQLMNYITHLKPKPERVFVVHGEKQKSIGFANFLVNKADVNTVVPSVLETVRLL
ncbi:MAG: beta-CASP ribonuclease aCPSF1 [Nitrososphaerota archaeon]|uniref:beta-CASP ribonuclease aCPSF1 n=1 Tax=Candidatus Bathycorpusculum sp. TaxID=2994959 RepID=UPI0028373D5E|nr:beta-CASP ribonuclease aCPSF1 [Candidatus Termiticorpusculum sp.]MCL2257176.1 beta-CASP ribonuclease aCPSF1 [Candidatus Termiticorpusculum sp.]MCL2292679.1 beta-CASP ribonuclease aCPSF1 [Candidatus Termiticorpusculum sp.]MDR0461546.1 beta-CASP ribonuclease aCPSF1 [Nitrososphaerota archaeon]